MRKLKFYASPLETIEIPIYCEGIKQWDSWGESGLSDTKPMSRIKKGIISCESIGHARQIGWGLVWQTVVLGTQDEIP